ncbi:MAG: DUF4112 domain-containing protein [Sphingomonadaceae bacterium]
MPTEENLPTMAEMAETRRMGIEFPVGNDPVAIRKRIETLEFLLERAISIPGLQRKVGLDALVGLVPVAGDIIAAGMGLYLVWEAKNLGMSRWHLARMVGNIGFDTLLGIVPVAGDLFDFVFRSNTRNLRIVKKWLDKHHPHTRVIDG